MEKINCACVITNESPFTDLAIECWLDNCILIDKQIDPGNNHLCFAFNDDEQEHILKLVFKNKNSNHTQVDEYGNILSDALVTLKSITFDEIEVIDHFLLNATYTHNFNGTQDYIEDSFWGMFGCNGTVQYNFFTPIYMWLLESM
jgi:hypothetical protein